MGSDTGAEGAVGLEDAMQGSGAGRRCCWMFLPSKETPEPGQALLLIKGKKQALERNSLCPFKAIQRLGREEPG